MSALRAPVTPVSPYKGLAAFEDSELDALFFFGREREREVLVANLLASRLTVLYGESGVGKSSLLAAAVVRDLRAAAPGAVVELHDTWSGGVDGLLDGVRGAGEAYLILDQFEEYFLYHGDADEPATLLHELPELLRETRTNVLISLREDSLARLDAFKARLPSVFANQIRLEHLDRAAAGRAILGPLDRWNALAEDHVRIEDDLVEAVLDDVTRDGGRVEAPYLQLVLERIWDAERAAGSQLLRLGTLRRLGGAETIVRFHLEGALGSLGPEEQDVAASMFEHLVTPSGTKIAHRAPDLAEYADVREDVLRRVLDDLTRARIVHSVDGSDRYEIFHDVLAEPIRAWRLHRRLEQERAAAHRRQRRLYVVVALVLAALAIVAALAVWAFSERGKAQDQARHARAGELDATALQQLDADPNRSVRLALAAAHLEPGRGTENVLRTALITDRLRLVKHVGVPVRAVATSPRRDLIAAALPGGKVLLLDARNRRLVRTIDAPRKVAAISFTDGGRRLVTASPQRLAQLWDVATGRRVPVAGRVVGARTPAGSLELVPVRGQLADEIAHVRNVAVAPDGELAAIVVAPGGQARAWLFRRDGEPLALLPPHGIRDLTFSPDGRLLATASAEGFTTIWDARTGRRVRALPDAKSGVDVVAFSPDGTLLASGSADSGIRIWNVATGERTYFLFGHTNPVTALVWSPDGRVVASGSPDRNVLLWRVKGIVGAGSLAATLAGSRGTIRALAFSADSTRLVTGDDGGTVRVWDARPDQQLNVLGRAPGPALAALWTGREVVGLWPRVVKTYDPATRRLLHALAPPRGARLTSLAAADDGAVVAAGGTAGRTFVWDARTGAALPAPPGTGAVRSVAVSARGELVASGDRSGTIRLWSARDGRLRWTARQPGGGVTALRFSPDGASLLSAGAGGALLWSVPDGHRLHRLLAPGRAVAAVFSPDGSLVAAVGGDEATRIWFAKTGNLYRVLHGHTKPPTDVAFGAGGHLLVTSGADSDAWLWNVDRGLGHVLQRGAFGPISAIAFDATGRWVAGAAPISAIVWTASSGRQLFYLRGHTAHLTDVTFAPDAPTVLTASRDGTIRTYTCGACVDLEALAHLARVRVAQTR